MTTFEEYKSQVTKTDDYEATIKAARTEYGVTIGPRSQYIDSDIPLNLEREYFDALLDENRMADARRLLDRMKVSYRNSMAGNIIEQYEYRLLVIEKTRTLMEKEIEKAKKEFDHHTLLIISIVVGVTTIFGTANNVIRAETFDQALNTFLGISFSMIFLICGVFVLGASTKR